MPLFLKDSVSSCQWGVWKTDESSEELLSMLPRKEAIWQEAQRFGTEHRRREWLAVRVLLRTLSGENKQIAYHPEGKPYLTDASAALSISHTKGYVALVLGPRVREIGIDIEQYAEKVKRVARKFMREDEKLSVFRGTDLWSLLLHWSAKETVFKCLNASEVDFRHHIRILPFSVEPEGVFFAEEYRTPERRRLAIRYLLCNDFVLTMSL